jgi:lysyl-tRNA synthetase class 2
MSSVFAVRRCLAVGVAAIAADAVLSASGLIASRHLATADVGSMSLPRLLALLVGLALLALTPRLWRDPRPGAALAIAGLLLLAVVNALSASWYGQAVPEAGVALLLVSGSTILAFRRPPAADGVGDRAHDLAGVRAIVAAHGEDSIAPFILRPDKAFHFAAGGVLAYRVIGRTAVVSGDPVAPDGSERDVLASFRALAHAHGWDVVLYGASSRHLETYRNLGLHAMCVGEEAVVDPSRFSLEGRAVRKLRQSVHRVERHGWEITARDGREIDRDLEAEIDALEHNWRATKSRIIGFSMGMGTAEGGVQPGDLYLLARSPGGELGAVMRFIAHRGKLSLDTMRRIGETPNGLNEALVCRALEVARRRSVAEVSLNYAGLAHLVRNEVPRRALVRKALRFGISVLGRHFQMERLVRFNDKFSPNWRPRYLVYESALALPRTVFRVLEAEGYVNQRARRRPPPQGQRWGRAMPRAQQPAARPESQYSR